MTSVSVVQNLYAHDDMILSVPVVGCVAVDCVLVCYFMARTSLVLHS